MSNLALVFENTDFNKLKKFENITFLPLSMEHYIVKILYQIFRTKAFF